MAINPFSYFLGRPPHPELAKVPSLSAEDLSATIPEGQHLMRKASPASVISPYYGEDFFRELFRANEANKALFKAAKPMPSPLWPGLIGDAYSRMYEEIPVAVGGPGMPIAHYMPEGGAPHDPQLLQAYPWLKGPAYVNTWGEEAAAAAGRSRDMIGPRALVAGSLTADRPHLSPEETVEHELSHHAFPSYYGRREDMWGYRKESMPQDVAEIGELEVPIPRRKGLSPRRKNPDGSVTVFLDDIAPIKIKDIHESWPNEFVGSLGRLQRETFLATGSRLKPGEFAKLVASGETPKYLTQEGQRMITYSRNVLESIEKSGEAFKGETKTWKKAKRDKSKRLKKTFLDRIEQILPTVVKADRIPGEMRLG